MIKTRLINPENYKYEVVERVIYKLKLTGYYVWWPVEGIKLLQDGTLTLYEKHTDVASFKYDGASGPVIDTKSVMDGAAVHDSLCRMARDGKLPYKLWKKFAKEMRRINKSVGNMSWAGRQVIYVGLLFDGDRHSKPAD